MTLELLDLKLLGGDAPPSPGVVASVVVGPAINVVPHCSLANLGGSGGAGSDSDSDDEEEEDGGEGGKPPDPTQHRCSLQGAADCTSSAEQASPSSSHASSKRKLVSVSGSSGRFAHTTLCRLGMLDGGLSSPNSSDSPPQPPRRRSRPNPATPPTSLPPADMAEADVAESSSEGTSNARGR